MADPTEIRYEKASHTLFVAFDDGCNFALPAELLRTQSPSAEVQGHAPSERKLISGRRHVGITGIEPVGNYAVRLIFDDLHDSGLFSWSYLHHLGENQAEIWQAYLDELAAAGLTRDPPGRA
ncbi:gamma-butyrobetaine hydroxylase-like domain-containing protein [Telmatospirillum siberiense]|uniref:Gamma-butyrobetaine hydroxylase-like N-terminal domain-containing protein n=1 Tax=Telmatospirillum siberiense TaxID=382514 RepID=A0A2N3PT51_9PROT|nr:DUF971 domain-containing protein [Telmatospirillum siberiense]PKU23583.1 hypothetical protein CWS72_16105 [Telmatospirillum siberiense]